MKKLVLALVAAFAMSAPAFAEHKAEHKKHEGEEAAASETHGDETTMGEHHDGDGHNHKSHKKVVARGKSRGSKKAHTSEN